MKERENAICAGLALLDHKIRSGNIGGQSERHPGGKSTNVFSAYAAINNPAKTQIFAKIGSDESGDYYLQRSPELMGIQIEPSGITGISQNIFDNEGKVQSSHVIYNSAENFSIHDKDMISNGPAFLITDTFTLQLKEREDDLQRLMDLLYWQGGFIALNLAGISRIKNPGDFLKRWLNRQRHIVFGNEKEFSCIEGFDSMSGAFPHSLLTVMTMGDRGSRINYQDMTLEIPAQPLHDFFVDEFGAGDCFMGVMIAAITRIPIESLTAKQIIDAAFIASTAASLVLTNRENRLTSSQISKIKRIVDSIF
jgi:sugar/nucleoside kinase (ribokinase family)